MKRFALTLAAVLASAVLASSAVAPTDSSAAHKKAKTAADTLVVIARITEIPGKFAANDLYNYVYIMKYRVLSVVKGSYKEQDILVGQYNPLIPRAQIKDAMKKNVAGNADKFEVGAKQKLSLIKPIDKVWKDAVEDEYADSDKDKYFAVKTDIAQ
jgi:3',5'-cyclic AMP phosphodiesterase CpdA